MAMLGYAALGLSLLRAASAKVQIEGACVENDTGLQWLSTALSANAAISCRGELLQTESTNHYWAKQWSQDSAVVVFPATTEDVSAAVKATQMTDLGRDFAFTSGGHAMSNSSSSDGFLIDLAWMNHTKVVEDFEIDGEKQRVISYGPGASTLSFQTALNGTGWTGIAARVGSVGMGGFSTGGGVGYLAGAYGYAVDRVVAIEVVLPSGDIVFATDRNEYSDLLWAFRGASLGSFGIITTFYQKTAPEPKIARLGFHMVADDSLEQAYANTVDFFNNNDDPFSVNFLAFVFGPLDATNPNPQPSDFSLNTIITTIHFDNPIATPGSQKSYEDTFAGLLAGLNILGSVENVLPYANLSIKGQDFFPYGMRHGFWGPQTETISQDFLRSGRKLLSEYIDTVLASGDFPATSSLVIQYMYPGLNGNLPANDEATAWPHSVAGHQILFNPGWMSEANDAYADQVNAEMSKLVYMEQARSISVASAEAVDITTDSVCGGRVLCDYPNYLSPGTPPQKVWGRNVPRLIEIKEKYDPECLLHPGKVLASKGCVEKGWANAFAISEDESLLEKVKKVVEHAEL